MTKPVLTQYDTDAEEYIEVLPKDEHKAIQKVLDRKNPVPSKRDKHKEHSSLSIRRDNPGGDWLRHQLDVPEVKELNSKGSPKRFGATTAWYPDDVLLPVSLLSRLKGASGEHTFVREESFNWLKGYMEENNKLPPMPHNAREQQTPMIQVNYAGDPWINEGNHRIKVAKALGWKYLPVSIRYYLGGEDVSDNHLSPRKVSYYHDKALAEGYTVKNFRGVLEETATIKELKVYETKK